MLGATHKEQGKEGWLTENLMGDNSIMGAQTYRQIFKNPVIWIKEVGGIDTVLHLEMEG